MGKMKDLVGDDAEAGVERERAREAVEPRRRREWGERVKKTWW